MVIKPLPADVICSFFLFENDIGIFARQVWQLGLRLSWLGPPTVTNETALKLAGLALCDTYGLADYAEDSRDAARPYGKTYGDAHRLGADNVSSWTYGGQAEMHRCERYILIQTVTFRGVFVCSGLTRFASGEHYGFRPATTAEGGC